jgi:hypothetical protein
LPPEQESTSSTIVTNTRAAMPGASSGLVEDGFPARGSVILETKVSRRKWFSGAFTYYCPDDSTVMKDMAQNALMAKKLLGLSLTPDVVWNLAPWSWAVDWFSNAGSVISNFSDWAMFGQCLRYGYIMEHTIATNTYTYVGPTGLGNTSYRPPPIVLRHETKVRRKANPFGFGLTWEGLSPVQLAIAAALGISRS